MSSKPSSPNQDTVWESLRPFVFGGISGMSATSCVQPIDNIKVRIQTVSEQEGMKSRESSTSNLKKVETGIFTTGSQMLKNEGIGSLYKGLDAGLLRQCCYASVRLGAFKYLSEKIEHSGHEMNTSERFALALTSGLIGSVIGNPLDLTLVRFQSDNFLPENQRRNYRHVFHALSTICREEGPTTLYRGFPSFACRVMALTSSQLTTFEEAKRAIMKLRGSTEADFICRLMYLSLTLTTQGGIHYRSSCQRSCTPI